MLLEITTLIVASRLAEVEKMLLMAGHLVIRETRTGHKEEVHNDKNK
jgi:hypothetical protein